MSGNLISAENGIAVFECRTEKQAKGLLKLLGAPLHHRFVADSGGYYRSGARYCYFEERGKFPALCS